MAVPRERLESELASFIAWFNQDAGQGPLDGLVRAGLTHLWFVTLHPFDDGNGRIARALTDLALEHAQAFRNGLEVTPWLSWFLRQVAEACAQSEQIVRRTFAKGAFWVQHREDPINGRQRKVLNRLLDAGPGGFQGGMTTRKYASLTHCSLITASRDLSELARSGCLTAFGGGRSTAYGIPWDAFLDGLG
jgi:Fic family protein